MWGGLHREDDLRLGLVVQPEPDAVAAELHELHLLPLHRAEPALLLVQADEQVRLTQGPVLDRREELLAQVPPRGSNPRKSRKNDKKARIFFWDLFEVRHARQERDRRVHGEARD